MGDIRMTLDLTQVLTTLITVLGSVITVIFASKAKGHADEAYKSASLRPMIYNPITMPPMPSLVNPRLSDHQDEVPLTPRDPQVKR